MFLLNTAVFFSAGVALVILLPVLPPWPVIAALLVLAVLSVRAAVHKSSVSFVCTFFSFLRVQDYRAVLFGMASLLLGAAWSLAFCHWTLRHVLPPQWQGEVTLRGHISDFPQRSERGWQVDFSVDAVAEPVSVPGQKSAGRVSMVPEGVFPARIRLAFNGDDAPQFDCEYTLPVALKPLHGLHNFSAFDYHAWLLQAGYVATASSKGAAQCEPQAPAPLHAQQKKLLHWRSSIASWIADASLSAHAASTLQALLIGNYADIDVMQWQVLRDSGTIHLLSVSGLHIVFVAAFVWWCSFHGLRCLVFPLRYLPAAHVASALSLMVALLYALLAGFSVATERSLVMVAVVVLQRMLYGKFTFFSALIVSLFVVLLLNPLCLLSAGFWFSFAATGLLMACVPHELQRERWLRAMVRPQWLVFVLMAPVLLYVYGRMPLLSLPMNFLAVPWVSFLVLPVAFIALLVAPVSALAAQYCLQVAGWLLDVYWWAMYKGVAWCAGWQLALPVNSLPAVVLAVSGMLLQVAPRTVPLRRAGLLLCVPLLVPDTVQLQAGDFRTTVVDVGQGLSVVVQTADHTLVYDTGNHYSRKFDIGRDVLAPYLRSEHIARVDMLMVSHADSDHAGGARGLLDNFPVLQRWSGMPVELQQKTARDFLPCRDGMLWRWEGVTFRVLSPEVDNPAASTNSRSCVVLVDNGKHRLLLTGDIDRSTEAGLLQRHAEQQGDDWRADNLRADVLIVPHHGSRSSSSPGFIAAVAPQQAVMSTGWRNRFHHPHAEVVSRYQQQGTLVLNTADTGALRWQFLADGRMTLEKAACTQRRFWRDDGGQCDSVPW